MLSTEHWRFFRSWLRAPRTVASAVPSSRALGRRIAARVPVERAGLIVELGGGTGSITRALLEGGVAPERLVVIEQNPEFAGFLQRKFPAIHVLNADAQALRATLLEREHTDRVAAVVSGLPLLTLPPAVTARILEECHAVLGSTGRFLQFTYGFRSPIPEAVAAKTGIRGIPTDTVWRNLPPAVVWSYTFPATVAGNGHPARTDSPAA